MLQLGLEVPGPAQVDRERHHAEDRGEQTGPAIVAGERLLVDGQDAIAVYEATTIAVKRARAGEGPTLIEALTYRFEDHPLGLERTRKSAYRSDQEVDA
ncbi:MAG: hypothetical protein IH809_05435, partial [Proteobacteria bacterium]|nr:hypothetical protein [Pseudomonadota bacterium]